MDARDLHEGDGGRIDAVAPRASALAVLRALVSGPRTVSEIVEETGLSQPNVSNHLARLRARGMVVSDREGRQVRYRLASAAMRSIASGWASPGRVASVEAVAAEFLEAVLGLREEDATRIVDEALAGGLTWSQLYLQVFDPALREVGERWERGALAVGAEHTVTGIVLRLMHRLSIYLPAAPEPDAHSAVVACVEGERHSVGCRMAADFLLARGWRVWYLGADLPRWALVEAVERHRPSSVLLSASLDDREESLVRTAGELRAWRGPGPLPLLVAGGRFFARPRLMAELDLYGRDLEAVLGALQVRMAEVLGARRERGR